MGVVQQDAPARGLCVCVCVRWGWHQQLHLLFVTFLNAVLETGLGGQVCWLV